MVPRISHRALISAFVYLVYFQMEVMVILFIMQDKLKITPPTTKLSLKTVSIPPHFLIPVPRFPHSHLPYPSFQSPHNRPNQALLLQTNPPNRHMPSVANKLNPAGRIFPLLIALGTLLPANTRLAASAISAP